MTLQADLSWNRYCWPQGTSIINWKLHWMPRLIDQNKIKGNIMLKYMRERTHIRLNQIVTNVSIKATTGGLWAHLHQANKPCVIRAIPSQTYGNVWWGPLKLAVWSQWGSSLPLVQRASTPWKIPGFTFVPLEISYFISHKRLILWTILEVIA